MKDEKIKKPSSFLANGQVVVKNQAQAMSQPRDSPPASTWARLHHPIFALWPKV
jgi:hypothetical protein